MVINRQSGTNLLDSSSPRKEHVPTDIHNAGTHEG